jgi:hypothetical protein
VQQKVLNTKCVFQVSLQLLSQTFVILGIIERGRSKMYISLHMKHPVLYPTVTKL